MRRRVLVVIACLGILTAGCVHLVPPPGPPPLRYRDLVFASVTKTADVVYGSAVNQQGETVTLRLDVYEPAGDTVSARPAIVWVHGGSFCCGNTTSPEIVDEATTFARKGYLTVSIAYRLSLGGCTPSAQPGECFRAIVDAMHDAQAAVRFLRANATTYRVDADRIAIGGTSAGAVTAVNVGFNPDDPGDSGNPGYPSAVGGAVSLSGAKIIGTADPGEAPSLLFHGTADAVVPYSLAQNTVNEARAAGLLSVITAWEGAGHVPYGEHRTEILDQTTNFLYSVLDLGDAAR